MRPGAARSRGCRGSTSGLVVWGAPAAPHAAVGCCGASVTDFATLVGDRFAPLHPLARWRRFARNQAGSAARSRRGAVAALGSRRRGRRYAPKPHRNLWGDRRRHRRRRTPLPASNRASHAPVNSVFRGVCPIEIRRRRLRPNRLHNNRRSIVHASPERAPKPPCGPKTRSSPGDALESAEFAVACGGLARARSRRPGRKRSRRRSAAPPMRSPKSGGQVNFARGGGAAAQRVAGGRPATEPAQHPTAKPARSVPDVGRDVDAEAGAGAGSGVEGDGSP